MNIKRFLVLLITVICITLNLAGLLLYKKHEQLQQYNKLIEHTYLVITHIQGFYGDIEKMVAIQRGYLLTGNKGYANGYSEAEAEMEKHFALAKKLTEDNPVQQKNLQKFASLIHRLKPMLATQMASQPFVLGDLHISVHDDFHEVLALSEQMRQLSNKMLEEEESVLAQRIADSQTVKEDYTNTLVLSSVVSVAVIILGNVLLLGLISRQRRIQDELDLTAERLELALKGTNDGIIDWIVHSRGIFLSPRFRAMLGYSAAELPDELAAYEALIHPDDLPNVRAYTSKYLKENLPDYRCIFRLRHRNGSWRWHMVRAISMVDRVKKKLRLVGAHTDITEQKTLEEKIISSNRELEEFTYIASHDLRAPLVNLKGFSGEIEHVLKKLTPFVHRALEHTPDAEQKEIREAIDADLPQAVGFIKSSVTRMDRLTQAILELSRLGRRELNFEMIDAEKMVDTCLKSLTHQLSTKQVEVIVGSLPAVTADAVSMEQVFGNILDNAIKYLDPSRPGKIEISAVATSAETVFQIRDNGRGIAEADLKKVFEIFKRAGNNDAIPGEGMGMPYIKSILRRHGGKIWCISNLGQGSSFFFTIPHHRPTEENSYA